MMKSRIQKKSTKTWPSLVNMVKRGKTKVKRDPIETLQGLIDMGATQCTLTRDEALLLLGSIKKLQAMYDSACDELACISEYGS